MEYHRKRLATENDVYKIAKMFIMAPSNMKTMSAKEAKNRFGYLIDTARHEPVTIEKHGRPVVVVLSAEDFDRLMSDTARSGPMGRGQ